jgi:hypothetical protein
VAIWREPAANHAGKGKWNSERGYWAARPEDRPEDESAGEVIASWGGWDPVGSLLVDPAVSYGVGVSQVAHQRGVNREVLCIREV